MRCHRLSFDRWIHYAVVLMGCGLLLSCGSGSNSTSVDVSEVAKASLALADGGWLVQCSLSHSLADDPIVFPRVKHPSAGHLHTFLGNKSTNAFSTYRKLRHAGTTCGLRADKGAYWFPAIYKNGRRVKPTDGDFRQRKPTFPVVAAARRGDLVEAGVCPGPGGPPFPHYFHSESMFSGTVQDQR